MASTDQRINHFAAFFKKYMSSAPVITAALPIPITAADLIPTYAEQSTFLTAYASLLCFLTVAFVFYRRHRIGTYLLPATWGKRSRIAGRFMLSWVPFLCMLATVACLVTYHTTLNLSLTLLPDAEFTSTSTLLANATVRELSWELQLRLLGSYLGMFVFSTLAFSLMAVREYMQTVLGLSDHDLVLKSGDPAVEKIGD